MSFQEFDNLEQMFQFMAEETDKANAALADEQKAVTWGSYWVRFYDLPARILIFGHIPTWGEFVAGERSHYPATMNTEETSEFEYTVARMRENHDRGYMFGSAYSILEPRGELGDTHRGNLWPISQDLFDHAEDRAWVMDDFDVRFKVELQGVWESFRAHAQATGYTHG